MHTGKELQHAVKTRFDFVIESQQKLLAIAQKLHKQLVTSLAPTGFRPIGDKPNEGTYFPYPLASYTPVMQGEDNNFFFITKFDIAITKSPESDWCEVTLFRKPYECVKDEIPPKLVEAVSDFIADAIESSTSANWVTAKGLHKRVETNDWEGV